MKHIWYTPLGPVTRKTLKNPMELEFREECLNQRLLDFYYEQQRAELADDISAINRRLEEGAG